MSQDRNPYYDSIRDKADRSEFASLRMDIEPRRQPAGSRGVGMLKVVACVLALLIIAAVAKRLLLA